MVCSKLIIRVPISFRDLPSCNGIDRAYNVDLGLYHFNRNFTLAVIQSVRFTIILCTSDKKFIPM